MINLMKFETDENGKITIVNEDELSLEPNSRYSAIASLPIPDGFLAYLANGGDDIASTSYKTMVYDYDCNEFRWVDSCMGFMSQSRVNICPKEMI